MRLLFEVFVEDFCLGFGLHLDDSRVLGEIFRSEVGSTLKIVVDFVSIKCVSRNVF